MKMPEIRRKIDALLEHCLSDADKIALLSTMLNHEIALSEHRRKQLEKKQKECRH